MFPENNEIVRLFGILRGQRRDNGSPDMASVSRVLDLYEIENKREIFDEIVMCFNIVARLENEKDKKVEDD